MDLLRRRESVCRTLFGPVDHEQLRRDLQQRLRDIMEEDSRRWNFNFQAGAPLDGRFQWEEVPAERAASFYQESDCPPPPHPGDGDRLRHPEDSAGTDQENCSRVSNTKSPAEETRRKRTISKPSAKPKKDARITGELVLHHFISSSPHHFISSLHNMDGL